MALPRIRMIHEYMPTLRDFYHDFNAEYRVAQLK